MIKVGIIGCGAIALKHAKILKESFVQDMSLVSVCDNNNKRAKKFAEEFEVSSYNNFHEMMKNEDIDLVSVLTHSGSHANIVIELAKYKKDIIVEKPIALTMNDALKMIRACDENGIRLFVVKQNRYNLPIKMLKEEISKGTFGKLNLGTIRVRWARDENYYNAEEWRGTWQKDGGVLCNQSIHHIDLLQWMMGDVDTVHAFGATRMANIEAEDTAIVSITFKNGALGIIEATTTARPSNIEASISILGDNGMVEISGKNVNEIRHWKLSNCNDEEKVIKKINEREEIFAGSHIDFYNDVALSIKQNLPPKIDGIEGLKSLKLVIAAYESIESRMPIDYENFKPKLTKLGIVDE